MKEDEYLLVWRTVCERGIFSAKNDDASKRWHQGFWSREMNSGFFGAKERIRGFLVMTGETDQDDEVLCFLSDSIRRVRSHISRESCFSPKLRERRRANVSRECRSSEDTFPDDVCRIWTKSSWICFWTDSEIEKSICLIEVRYLLILSSSSWFKYSFKMAEKTWSGSRLDVT